MEVPQEDQTIEGQAGKEVVVEVMPTGVQVPVVPLPSDAEMVKAEAQSSKGNQGNYPVDIFSSAKRYDGRYFIPIKLGKNIQPVRFTARELRIVECFLEVGSVLETAKRSGVSLETVRRVLKRKAVLSLLAEKLRERAVVERYDSSAIRAEILEVALGHKQASKTQVDALKYAMSLFSDLSEGKRGGLYDLPPGLEIGVVLRRKAQGE